MNTRRMQQSGQALVLVTLALFAMCGIMGLAVDLGWSFFVKKEAQAVGDAAALAAVREGSLRLNGNFSGYKCGAPTNNTQPYCAQTAIDCSSLAAGSASNLENGCAYAARNGFTSGTNNQKVTIQAYDSTIAPAGVTGLNSTTISYWVTVRAVQSIPQLFSAVLGNKLSVVSTISTAAVVGTVVPGNLITLGQAGDCVTATSLFGTSQDCGVNIHVNGFITSDSISATGSISMASGCTGATATGCTTGGLFGSTAAHAGIISNFFSANSVSSNAGIYTVNGTNSVTGSPWTPNPIQASSSALGDPTVGLPQPGFNASPGQAPACGIPGGTIGTLNTGTTTVGPYSYYACNLNSKGTTCTPSGAPIVLQGNVMFQANGACSTGFQAGFGNPGASPQINSTFPSYFFYGGLDISGAGSFYQNPTTSFGPGQYVMVGAKPQTSGDAGSVFAVNGNGFSIQPVVQSVDTSGTPIAIPAYGSSTPPPAGDAGNMFIFTAPPNSVAGYPGYPGLAAQIATLPSGVTNGLQPGSVDFNAPLGGQMSLLGIQQTSTALPATLDQYNSVLFWQDRSNSTVTYSSTGQVTSSTNSWSKNMPTGSTGLNMFGIIGNNVVHLDGAIYQPRGAYISDNQNVSVTGNNVFQTNVQIVTGAIELGGFVTNNAIKLGLPTNLLIRYTNGLIQ